MKTRLKFQPISARAVGRIGILLGAAGVAVAVFLMPVMPGFVGWIELDVVLATGVVSGFFMAAGILVMPDSRSGALLAAPVLVVSAATGCLVWPWAGPAAFAALSFSWLAVAIAIGCATWKKFQQGPTPPNGRRGALES